MAKSNKNSNKQIDAPCGYVYYKTFDDKVEIDFAYKQRINQTQSVERFSEIEVLNFVARSYEESCLKLWGTTIKREKSGTTFSWNTW